MGGASASSDKDERNANEQRGEPASTVTVIVDPTFGISRGTVARGVVFPGVVAPGVVAPGATVVPLPGAVVSTGAA